MMNSIGLICSISSLFLTVSGECGKYVRWKDNEALSVLMEKPEMRCADMNLTTERRLCKMMSMDDGRHLLCGGNGQDNTCNRPISVCPDGSLNKMCFPLSTSNSINYMCICNSIGDHVSLGSKVTQTSWSPWLRIADQEGLNYTRKIYTNSSSKCLLQEYRSVILMNIISEYQLLDSIFSASSVAADSRHASHRARLDMYFDFPCGWVAGAKSTSEWLQIQLQPSYTVGGILIKKRCDQFNQYSKAVTVKTAEDDLQWQDVIVNQNLLYADDEATLWFPMIYTTPIWRVYVTDYYDHPAMKCDLKGFRNN